MNAVNYFDKYATYWEAENTAILESYDEEIALSYFTESGEKKSIGKRILDQIRNIFDKARGVIQSLVDKISGKKKKLPPEIAAKKIKLQKQCKCDPKWISRIEKAKTMEELTHIEHAINTNKIVKTITVGISAAALIAGAGKLIVQHNKNAKQVQGQVETALMVVEKQETALALKQDGKGTKGGTAAPDAKDARIAALEKQVSNLKNSLKNSHGDEIAGKNKEIESKTARIKELEQQISKLETGNQRSRTYINKLRSENAELIREKRSLLAKISSLFAKAEVAAAQEIATANNKVANIAVVSDGKTTEKKVTVKGSTADQIGDRLAGLKVDANKKTASGIYLSSGDDDSAIVGNYLFYLEDGDDPESVQVMRLDPMDESENDFLESADEFDGLDDFDPFFEESSDDEDFRDLDFFEESEEDDFSEDLEDFEESAEEVDDELDALIASL